MGDEIALDANGAAAQSGWRLLREPLYVQGHLHGSAYPSLIFSVEPGALDRAAREEVARHLDHTFPALDVPPPPEGEDSLSVQDWLLRCLNALQLLANGAIFETGQVLRSEAQEWRWLVPTELRTREELSVAFQRLLALIRAVAAGEAAGPLIGLVAHAWDDLAKKCLPNSNSRNFIEAAIERGIPTTELVEYIWQFGTGRYGRWLYSSLTDITPNISAHIARAKWLTADLLRRAGVPVPRHRLAATADEAVQVAESLGYPVVVKPADLDGGKGVTTDLVSAEEVRAAFAQCQALSPNVLVEKHIFGRDYRIVVFAGQAVLAIERRPGGVVGNGRDTIADLLEALNSDPMRIGENTPLHQVEVDEEALAILAKQGLTLESVPDAGHFVRLRRASNIALGGTPIVVLDQAHPDNLELAVRAARILRLDLAGIDLLIPDITRSWREGGAAICEVNAQPTLGKLTSGHIYGEIVEHLVGGRHGRIPVILVVGANRPREIVAVIEREFLAAGIALGCHDLHSARLAGQVQMEGAITPYRAGRALALDRTTAAILLCINDLSVMATGLPTDRYDVLVVAGNGFALPANAGTGELDEMMRMLAATCSGAILRLEGAPASSEWLAGAKAAVRPAPTSHADLPQILLKAVAQ